MDSIEEIKKQYRDLCKTLDNNINFLSIVPISENKHTEILAEILRYRLNGKQAFIKSFLKCAFSDSVFNDEWSISTQNNYMDCFLKSKTNAVIIENKVHGAADQHKQIQSYLEGLLRNNQYRIDNIYVIYLTAFGGSPNPDSLSLPDDRKNELNGRYVEINYNNDILPWLEKDVLPQCPYREQSLISSIQLYIDCLKRMLGIDVRQQTIAKKMRNILAKNGLNEYSAIKQELSIVKDDEEYSQILNTVLRQMEKENVYCSDVNVSYNLKWLLRNSPTPEYKLAWVKRNYSPFNSIGYFTLNGVRFVQLSTILCGKFIRIHMVCNPEGIKTGPYVLTNSSSVDILHELWNINELEQGGFELRDNVLIYPFADFTPKMPLTEVAAHIWCMIQKLKNAEKQKFVENTSIEPTTVK